MQIYIMRHGEAESFASSDESRVLTQRGKEQSQQMASWLATQLNSLDIVLVSPYIRAQETWQSCISVLPKAGKVLTEEGITPYGDSAHVSTYIKALISIENPSNILIISHLPLVGHLSTEFDVSVAPLSFPTSAICQIEYDPVSALGEVQSLQTPHSL